MSCLRDKYSNNVHLMMSALRLHRIRCEQLVGQLGIHHSQHQLLMYLSKSRNAPSQKDIAKEFGVSYAAVAVTIKKLESSGYISRTTDDKDMRQNRIQITQQGRKIIDRSRSIFHSVDKCMFKDFNDDQLNEFTNYLMKIETNLSDEER